MTERVHRQSDEEYYGDDADAGVDDDNWMLMLMMISGC